MGERGQDDGCCPGGLRLKYPEGRKRPAWVTRAGTGSRLPAPVPDCLDYCLTESLGEFPRRFLWAIGSLAG